MSLGGLLRAVRDILVALAASVLRRHPGVAARLLEAVRLVPMSSVRVRLYRGFSWPLTGALGTRVIVGVAGGRMECDTADALGRVVAVSGTWEPNSTAVVRRLLSPGDVAVDVGAHAGYYTLLCADLVGPAGHVYAFEPSPTRYQELRANIERSSVTNVTALDLAAGARDGTAILHEAPRPNTSASTMAPAALDFRAVATGDYEPVGVGVVTVDSRVPLDDLALVRLVKVDVEGYEVEALQGAEGVFAAASPLAVLVEVSPLWSSEGPSYVQRLCERHGFSAWLVANEYSVPGYFARRPRPPVAVSVIPSERCDVLLCRGFTVADITGEGRTS